MPALPLALAAFAVGTVLLQWQPMLPHAAAWLGAAAAFGLAGFLARLRAPPASATGYVAGFLAIAAAAALGYGYAAWRAEMRLADALPAAWEGADIAVVGVVDDLPQASDLGTRFAFAVERVETAGAIVPERLSLAWYAQRRKGGEVDEIPALAAGERWRLIVRLKRPHGTVNPYGFDVEAWLLENGIRATGYVRNDDANNRIAAFAGRASDYVQRARTAVRDRIVDALPDQPYAGVIVALTIGEQRAIPEAQWRVFNRTGITHLISISGLHVTVFAAIAGGIAYLLARRSARLTGRVPARKVAAVVGVTAATLYVLLAGAQVPAVRTLLMLAVAAVGLMLARPGTAAVVWLWALAVVLVWDPWAGFAPGFWLSFGAVGLLLYAHAGRLASPSPASRGARAAARVARGDSRPDADHDRPRSGDARAVPAGVAGLAGGERAGDSGRDLCRRAAGARSVSSFPSTLPFQVAHAVFAALMISLDWLSTAPAAVWQQHAPPAWTVAVAIAGVAWIAAPRGVPGRGLALLALVPLFVVRPPAPAPGRFTMTVLDVGQGLAVVVQTHAARAALRHRSALHGVGGRRRPHRRAVSFARQASRRLDAHGRHASGQPTTAAARCRCSQTVPVDWLASSLPEDNAILAERARDGGAALRCDRGPALGMGRRALHRAAAGGGASTPTPRVKPNDLSCVVRDRFRLRHARSSPATSRRAASWSSCVATPRR